MGETVTPLPHTPSWRGAQLGGHRDNFIMWEHCTPNNSCFDVAGFTIRPHYQY